MTVIAELIKLRRTAAPWVSLVVVLFAVGGIGLLTWMVIDPQRAAAAGLLGAKANLAGLSATWPVFGGYLTLIAGAIGMLLLAFIVAYLFGREYADDTAKNMLALPIPRAAFVLAKFTVAALWWLVLVVVLLLAGFATGAALALPGLNAAVANQLIVATLQAAAVSFLLVPVVGWITVATRSYLAGPGFALGMLLAGNLLGHTGWAVWFPWSIVPIMTGMSGAASELPVGSYLVVALTFVAGVLGSVWQVRSADNP